MSDLILNAAIENVRWLYAHVVTVSILPTFYILYCVINEKRTKLLTLSMCILFISLLVVPTIAVLAFFVLKGEIW